MTDHKTRIIVVDGSSVTRAILTRILRDEVKDADVYPCASGEEALTLLSSGKYDLISTALMLPDMDGLELSRQVRASRTHSYIPVIVVSGDADKRLLREGFEAGVTDYFDKSKGYKAFGDFIHSFIQRHSGLVGHILFVEDSATAAAVTQKILQKHGLKVTRVANAEDAINLMYPMETQHSKAAEEYDMVITDFYLEGDMTGGDLLHAIRAKLHMSQQEMPVLVLTSTEDQSTQVEAFHAGANDFVSKPIVEEILIARVRALLMIKHQFDALKEQAEAMRWIAATDSLTGVRSKRYLVDNGEEFIHEPANNPVWGMLIDIDHFKQINDTLGHITGDHVLAELGEKLNKSFKDSMVVRFGGEEFCILVPKVNKEQMLERAEFLRQEIAQLRPANVDVTVSIGLACSCDHPNVTLTRFIALADKALYSAKENGRNRVYIYDENGPMLSPMHTTDSQVEERSSSRRSYELTSEGRYRVRRGDTLHAIAFSFGLDWRDVAAWNGIRPPYQIYPDQELRLSPPPAQAAKPTVSTPPPKPVARKAEPDPAAATASRPAAAHSETSPAPRSEPSKPLAQPAAADPGAWLWPADGRLLSRFAPNDPSRNGIEIGGVEGQPVVAAAGGQVVYSGNGLIGYGELIIIKHSDRLLSAYAHNKRRLVSEGQTVAAGERIAEMGHNERNQAMLHFEIRVNGTPQDPLRFLPRR